jgi:translation initiation factor 1
LEFLFKKYNCFTISFVSQTRLNSALNGNNLERMAVICNTCGLPEDLCACGELAKDSTKIIIRLETRRFKKKGTMIEGLDPKLNNLETVAKELKNKYACGGTAKDGYIFLQGDHRDTIKETLIRLGFPESSIELH